MRMFGSTRRHWPAPPWPGSAAVVLITASFVVGCGGGKADVERPAAGATSTPAAATSSSTATAPGAGPSQPDGRVGKGSPGEIVLRLGRYLQLGAVPAAVLLYDERARAAVGVAPLAGALEMETRLFQGATLRIWSTEKTDAGTLVSLRASAASGSPRTYAYLMKRRAGGWSIAYDELTDRSIRAFVAGSERTSPRAAVDADRVASKFRNSALSKR
jgi:hypothetical protein